jgi:hypothetical protein
MARIANPRQPGIAEIFEKRMESFKNRTATELADKMMMHVTK